MKKSILSIAIATIALLSGMEVKTLISPAIAESKQQTLPEFGMPDLDGKLHNVKEWQGKILIINFWATWCPPCLKEMSEFEAMQNEFAKKNVQFIGIALDDPEPVKEFITQKKITYPILIGQESGTKIAHALGNVVNTVPFTVIFDSKGQLIKRQMGTLDRKAIMEIITPLLTAK